MWCLTNTPSCPLGLGAKKADILYGTKQTTILGLRTDYDTIYNNSLPPIYILSTLRLRDTFLKHIYKVKSDNQTDSTLTASHTVVTEQPCNLSKPNLTNHLT